jgi:hypothetical protein
MQKFLIHRVGVEALFKSDQQALINKWRCEAITILICRLENVPWTFIVCLARRDTIWAVTPYYDLMENYWNWVWRMDGENRCAGYRAELKKAGIQIAEVPWQFKVPDYDGKTRQCWDEKWFHTAQIHQDHEAEFINYLMHFWKSVGSEVTEICVDSQVSKAWLTPALSSQKSLQQWVSLLENNRQVQLDLTAFERARPIICFFTATRYDTETTAVANALNFLRARYVRLTASPRHFGLIYALHEELSCESPPFWSVQDNTKHEIKTYLDDMKLRFPVLYQDAIKSPN